MTLYEPVPEFDPRFLDAMSQSAEAELARHNEQRREWNYHDILTRDVIAELAASPTIEVERAVRNIFLGNLAVEKGHAEYDRVTSEVFEQHPTFRAWKNRWVAEEEPHGAAMLEWAKVRGLLDMTEVHEVVQGFLRNGLSLTFGDAAYGLAYPALQEPATKVTHREVMQRLPEEERVGIKLMGKIIADEERHERFYANMVRHALHSGEADLASHQMRGLTQAVLGFAMPGIETDIPRGKRITVAYIRTGAFTLGKVANEVLLPAIDGEGKHKWDIEHVEALDDSGKRAQATLLDFRDKLAAVRDDDEGIMSLLAMGREIVQPAHAA